MERIKISVVMAVYNGEVYLREAMESIIRQTYQNWELIVVDDASTDRTPQILAGYQDQRIHVLTNPTNLKLPASLNRGIAAATGKYILRMDADDICRLDRFEKQVAFMESHPETAFSWGLGIPYTNGAMQTSFLTYSLSYRMIQALFLFFCPVYHSCVIIRREIFRSFQYDSSFTISEDLELWTRISRKHQFHGQRSYYILYRKHAGQATNSKNRDLQRTQVKKIISAFLEEAHIVFNDRELEFHMELLYGEDPVETDKMICWMKLFIQKNRLNGFFQPGGLKYAMMWKIDELFRAKRLSLPSYLKAGIKISIFSLFSYWLKKLVHAVSDLFHREAAIRNFGASLR